MDKPEAIKLCRYSGWMAECEDGLPHCEYFKPMMIYPDGECQKDGQPCATMRYVREDVVERMLESVGVSPVMDIDDCPQACCASGQECDEAEETNKAEG